MNNGNDRGACFAETGPGREGFNPYGVRPAADDIPPGEPRYSIARGSAGPVALGRCAGPCECCEELPPGKWADQDAALYVEDGTEYPMPDESGLQD
jgi:hypothetical protein